MVDISDTVEEHFLEKIHRKLTDQQLMRQDGLPKILLRQDLLQKCEVQLSYAIGVVEPVSIRVETIWNWNS